VTPEPEGAGKANTFPSRTTLTETIAEAMAVLVAPVLLPLAWVEVYKPVTREVFTNKEVEFDVEIDIAGPTFVQSVTHDAVVSALLQPATATVLIPAVAWVSAIAKLDPRAKASAAIGISLFIFF